MKAARLRLAARSQSGAPDFPSLLNPGGLSRNATGAAEAFVPFGISTPPYLISPLFSTHG